MDQDTKDGIESFAKGLAKGLSEPIKVAIEKLSNAVGGFSEGWLIERRAKAKGRARLIDVDSKIEATRRIESFKVEFEGRHERALKRKAFEATRQQENLENIVEQSLWLLPPQVSEEPIDPDWMAYFIDQSQDFSNENMRTVWAKILANEIATPGSFSRRALMTVKLMSFSEAAAFTALCSFGWYLDGVVDLIAEREYVYAHEDEVENLASIGLVSLDTARWTSRPIEQRLIQAHYFDQQVVLGPPEELEVLELGFVGLSHLGRELLTIAGGQPDWDYFEKRIAQWKSEGFSITRVPAHPSHSTDQGRS